MKIYEKANGLLKLLAQKTGGLGKPLKFSEFGRIDDIHREMMAVIESKDQDEVRGLMMHLWDKGWITQDLTFRKNSPADFERNPFDKGIVYVTAEGLNHLEELEKSAPDPSKAFVAMWFHESMKEVRERGIKPAIIDAGYDPFLIDEDKYIGKIDDRIIAEIRRSKFIVADFTQGKDGARGSVYYEAGFARGLEITVFSTCSKNSINDVHFDTRQYNHIVWETPEDLRKKLADSISAEVGDGPKKRSQKQIQDN